MIDHHGLDSGARLDGRLLNLVLDTTELDIFLDEVTLLAAGSFSTPGNPVMCAVTVLRRKKPCNVGGSADAAVLEELQCELLAGPGRSAMKTKQCVLVPDVHGETRWPRFMEAAGQAGIGSLLAVPLEAGDDVQSALTLYASKTYAFEDDDVSAAEAFAAHASKAVRLVLRVTESIQARNDMAAAMQSRTAIDVATGVLMAENRCSQAEAIQIMRRASNNRNLKLRDLARQITDAVSSGRQVTSHFDA